MASFNRVIVLGNLTKDVELKYLESGTAIANIGLAVNDRRKKGEEWVEEVSFFDVTLFARNAEVASEYLSKGSPVLFEGRLKQDRWTTKDDENRSKVHIVAERMQLLGSRREKQEEGGEHVTEHEPVAAAAGGDDIPF